MTDSTGSATRAKWLISGGIAAAVIVVGGVGYALGVSAGNGDAPKPTSTTVARTTTTTSTTTTTTVPPTTTTSPPPPTAAPVTATTARHAIGKIGETLSYSQPASGVVDYKCKFTTNYSDGTQYVTYQNVRNLGCGDGVTPEYPR